MFDKVQESLKKAKTSARKSVLKRNGFVLRKPQQKQFVRKSGFNRRRKKIQAEKDRLLSLDDKGLMVELILAVRGLYSQMEYIQSQQASLSERVDDIESDISSIRSDISDLESRLGSSDQ